MIDDLSALNFISKKIEDSKEKFQEKERKNTLCLLDGTNKDYQLSLSKKQSIDRDKDNKEIANDDSFKQIDSISKFKLTSELLKLSVNEDSINHLNSKAQKDKVNGFAKKMIEIQDKDNHILNELDKEFLHDAKTNLNKLKNFLIQDILKRQEAIKSTVNLVKEIGDTDSKSDNQMKIESEDNLINTNKSNNKQLFNQNYSDLINGNSNH